MANRKTESPLGLLHRRSLGSVLRTWLPRLPLVICVSLFLFHFSLIEKYAVNIPYQDEWGLIFGDNHPASVDLWWLYAQVNDHRTATTKLFVWLQFHLNHWNIRTQQVLDFLIYGTILVLLVLFARRLIPQTWIVLCFVVFLISPIIGFDHILVYAVAVHFWLLFFVISAYFLFAEAQKWFALVIACVASILSIYSFGSGFITSFVLLMMFSLFKCFCAVRASSGKERIHEVLQLSLVAALIGGALVTWIVGYHKPPYISSFALPYTMTFWSFFLNLVSFSFGIDRLSRTLGAICVLIVVVPICAEVWKRKGRLSNTQWAAYAMAVAILGDLAAVAMGRAGFGILWSKVEEYAEHGMPLIILSVVNWVVFLKGRRKLQIASTVTLWFFCFAAFSDNWNFDIYARASAQRMANYRCVEAYYEQVSNGHCPGTFADTPHPEIFLEQARRLNVSFYQEMRQHIQLKREKGSAP